MGKKFLCLIVAVCCIVLCLSSCNSVSIDMDNTSSDVSSNGGFVVETGDYIYFINGVESYSTTYKTGKVTKAALMRTKKSNITKIGGEGIAESDCQTVVSKLIVSSDFKAGYYIYDGYVYYAVPSTENDKTGSVKSDKLNFFRTKLDGSDTSAKIADKDYSYSTQFRYIKAGDKVYLVVYSSGIFVYDTATRKQVYSYEKTIDEFMFDEDNASTDLFFTIKPINEHLYDPDSDDAKQASYQEIHKVSLGNEVVETIVLSGAGKYVVNDPDSDLGGEQDGSGIGLTGATFDLIRHKDGILYFSYTYLDTTLGSTIYVALTDAEITSEPATTMANAQKAENILNTGNKNASNIFTDNAIIVSKDCIVYIDSTYGLLKYDYNMRDDDSTDFGVTRVFYNDNIKSATISSYTGDYLYYYDSSNNYYRINLKDAVEGKEVSEMRINKLAINSAWYAPEVINYNGNEYFVCSYGDAAYKSYCYVIDMTATKKAYDETEEDEKDEFYNYDETYEFVNGVVNTTKLGVMTDADREAFEEYVDDLERESTEESAE